MIKKEVIFILDLRRNEDPVRSFFLPHRSSIIVPMAAKGQEDGYLYRILSKPHRPSMIAPLAGKGP